jgi:hypothetical protein
MPTFTWTAPDPLNSTAKTRSIYITELQAAANVRRAEIGLVPITFIDQSIGKKFRLDAIEELKTVTNDLAILFGYPTGVQDPLLLGRPYVTITKKYGKYVCHYPILNDLRLVLNLLEIQLKFNLILPVTTGWAIVSEYKDSSMKINNVVHFGVGYPTSVFWSDKVVFSELHHDDGSIFITRINKDTGVFWLSWDVGDVIRHKRGKDICAGQQGTDLNYQYVIGTPLIGGNNKVIRYKNITTSDLVATDIFDLGANYTSSSITNNENFVFVGGQNWAGIPSYWNAVITKLAKGVTMSLAAQNSFYLDLITLPIGGTVEGKQANISALTIDSSYIYCFYQEQLQYKILPAPTVITLLKSAIIKISLNTLSPSLLIEHDDTIQGFYTYPLLAGTAIQGDYLYTMGEQHLPILGKLVVRGKSGNFINSFNSLDYKDGSGSEVISAGHRNCIASNDERLIAIPT